MTWGDFRKAGWFIQILPVLFAYLFFLPGREDDGCHICIFRRESQGVFYFSSLLNSFPLKCSVCQCALTLTSIFCIPSFYKATFFYLIFNGQYKQLPNEMVLGHIGEEKGDSLGGEKGGEERRGKIREQGLACSPTCFQIQILLPLPKWCNYSYVLEYLALYHI